MKMYNTLMARKDITLWLCIMYYVLCIMYYDYDYDFVLNIDFK